MLGAKISGFFNTPELSKALRKKTHTRNMIVNCHDDKLALDHIPVSSTKLSDNASVILFQPVQKIQDAGNQIRKKLSESGFYAKYTFDHIIYHCQEMKRLVEMAQLYSRTASNIMIVGETGTGKELFAQSIHNAGTPFKWPLCGRELRRIAREPSGKRALRLCARGLYRRLPWRQDRAFRVGP